MKTTHILSSLFTGAALLLASNLSAATTDPVGYVTFTAADNSDLLVGVPLTQSPVFSGAVDAVTTGQVSFSSTLPDLTDATYFLMVTADTSQLEGQWFTITSSDTSSVTVEEDLASLGLTASDTISVFPFWTLDSLFPSGGDIPASSDVFSPVASILINDVTAAGVNLPTVTSYIYHDGSQGAAGWYDVNDLGSGLVGDTILTPETFIRIRNRSGAGVSIVLSGSVPTGPIANNIISRSAGRQDNQVVNPYPGDFTLANSNLVTSGAFEASTDVFAPKDILFTYETAGSVIRPGASKAFLYHDGSQGAEGWYDINNLGAGLQDSFEVPAGAALVIRKGIGSDVSASWSPNVPYNL